MPPAVSAATPSRSTAWAASPPTPPPPSTPERRPTALAAIPGFKHWIAYMQVRTKLLDDAVRNFVELGGTQLVLLGAGFDCRALRMPELDGVHVFEVDHPATQTHKIRTLEKI